MRHGDPRGRASASEYLDNILKGHLRKHIMPVIEDLPLEEKVRRGNVAPQDAPARPRGNAAAADQRRRPGDRRRRDRRRARTGAVGLGDDVEHVLAYRDAQDWYVFEAASWALAERRMPASSGDASCGSSRCRRPRSPAGFATLPLFASVSVDELFRIAGASRQVRHEPGTVLLQEGTVPDTIHVLLDGRVTATRQGARATRDRRAGGIRLRRSAARGASAPHGPDGRGRRHAGAERRRAADAARRQHCPRPRPVHDARRSRRARRRRATCSRRTRPATSSSSRRTDCGRWRKSSRFSASRYSPGFQSTKCGRSPRSPTRVRCVAGEALFPASAPVALWVIISGEAVLRDVTPGQQMPAAPATSSVRSRCSRDGR